MSKVPAGWKFIDLGTVITHQKGYAFNSACYKSSGVRIIRISDTTKNSIHNNNPVYISNKDAEELDNYNVFGGDMILSTVGSRPHLIESRVGKVVQIPFDIEPCLLNQNLVKISPRKSFVKNSYLFDILRDEKFVTYISTLVRGNANQVSITLSDIFKYNFLLPPLPEQIKIAQILSTWDKAIATTEKLIGNSQQQKKALMQSLLTGKKRLPGFEGEWSETLLGDIAYITTGNSNRQDSNLDGNYAFFDRSEDVRTSNIYLFDCEAVIVPGEGQDFVPKYFHGKFDLHQRTYAIMNINGCDAKFIFFAISYFRGYLLSQAVGSTVKSLRLPMFKKMPLVLPPLPEQQKIAAVLTAADNEIDLLQKKLAFLKQEKAALMQQLLTGKRRVKVEAA
jgi:type I restriction enzyme S subunit